MIRFHKIRQPWLVPLVTTFLVLPISIWNKYTQSIFNLKLSELSWGPVKAGYSTVLFYRNRRLDATLINSKNFMEVNMTGNLISYLDEFIFQCCWNQPIVKRLSNYIILAKGLIVLSFLCTTEESHKRYWSDSSSPKLMIFFTVHSSLGLRSHHQIQDFKERKGRYDSLPNVNIKWVIMGSKNRIR